MKKFIILFLLISQTGIAQDCLRELGGGACIVMENDKYGIKKKGKYIVPTYFDQIADHSGKFFSVEQNGKWGIFNIKGQIVLPVGYDKVTAINADAGLITATGSGYNSLVITENLVLPRDAQKANPFLMVSMGEVSIGEYFTFMQDLKNNPPKDYTYEMSLPDTANMAANTRKIYLACLNGNGCEKPYDAFDKKLGLATKLPCSVFGNKLLFDYLKLPVNGISYDQAQRYCVWLTEKFNAYYTDGEAYEMLVRLPRPMEWEEVALAGLDESMKTRQCIDSLNAKACPLFNYVYDKKVCTNTEEQTKKYSDNVVPVISYNPDFNGLYCLFGNVAEMTSAEGIAKGGSYMHYARKCITDNNQKYNGPSPWVGFRWVVEYNMRK